MRTVLCISPRLRENRETMNSEDAMQCTMASHATVYRPQASCVSLAVTETTTLSCLQQLIGAPGNRNPLGRVQLLLQCKQLRDTCVA